MIVLNEIEYAITATCLEEKFLLEMEKGWDAVISSFAITNENAETESGTHTLKSEVLVEPIAKMEGVEREISSKEKPAGVKTYRNEEQGFAIDVPEAWVLPTANPYRSFLGNRSYLVAGRRKPSIYRSDRSCRNPPSLISSNANSVPMLNATVHRSATFGRVEALKANNTCGRAITWGREGAGRKYLLVLGATEYAVTATCFDPGMLVKKEKVWDEIVKSFHLSRSQKQEIQGIKIYRRDTAGALYEKAYEAVANDSDAEARNLLEQCLRDDPDHILAHKELAVILKKERDLNGALFHRQEVKRLDPSDKVNRYNLSFLLAWLGQKEAALQEAGRYWLWSRTIQAFRLL